MKKWTVRLVQDPNKVIEADVIEVTAYDVRFKNASGLTVFVASLEQFVWAEVN